MTGAPPPALTSPDAFHRLFQRHERFSERDWDRMHRFVEAITGKALNSTLTPRVADSRFGRFSVKALAEPQEPYFRAFDSFLRDTYRDFYAALDELGSDANVPEINLVQLSSFAGTFAWAVTPGECSDDDRFVMGNYILWMYFYDDYLTKLIAQRRGLGPSIARYNDFYLECWRLGLQGHDVPRVRDYVPYAPPLDTSRIDALDSLGPALYRVGRLLRERCPTPGVHLDDATYFSIELYNYLDSLVTQAKRAPATPAEYLAQHANSGGVKSCLYLGVVLNAWRHDVCGAMASIDPHTLRRLVNTADLLILLENDAMAGKDIGHAEELYYATLLKDMITKPGRYGLRGGFVARYRGVAEQIDLSTPTGHGELLRELGRTHAGFVAMKLLNQQIRATGAQAVRAARAVIERNRDQRLAPLITEAVLHWGFGYFLFNAITPRYADAFAWYLGAVNDDLRQFQAVFDQLAAQEPATRQDADSTEIWTFEVY